MTLRPRMRVFHSLDNLFYNKLYNQHFSCIFAFQGTRMGYDDRFAIASSVAKPIRCGNGSCQKLVVKLLNYVLKTLDQTETIIKNLYYEH